MTVGDNPDPLLNPTVYTSSTTWAREIKVGAWGTYVGIVRTTNNNLSLTYVAVFATEADCNEIPTDRNVPINANNLSILYPV